MRFKKFEQQILESLKGEENKGGGVGGEKKQGKGRWILFLILLIIILYVYWNYFRY
ncbi:hypothetical protein HYS48_02940 [Candidatus Woesearchaeota archaeon]|nr:hypothetical protein [Candidatus Woesearchaeota archaeon]